MKIVRTLNKHTNRILDLLFNDAFNHQISFDVGGFLFIAKSSDKSTVYFDQAHSNKILGIRFYPDMLLMVSYDEAGVVKVWDYTQSYLTIKIKIDPMIPQYIT